MGRKGIRMRGEERELVEGKGSRVLQVFNRTLTNDNGVNAAMSAMIASVCRLVFSNVCHSSSSSDGTGSYI